MEEQKMEGMSKGHGMHWSCCLMPIVGHLAFAWGVLSLVLAFMAGATEMVWGMPAGAWMWSGLVAGVLAMSGTKKKMRSCRCGSCGSSSCGGCGDHGKCEGGKCC